jgi:uncharacterized protein (TIGR03118 family)
MHMVLPFRRQRLRPTQRLCVRPTLEVLEGRALFSGGFAETSLVSDIPGVANHTDTDLVNPWGFAETPHGRFRLSANGTGESLLLNARGDVLGRPVIIPTPSDSPSGAVAAPDGSALNTTSDFVISHDGRSAPATFIVSTEDGTIAGFNRVVDRNEAVIGADLSDSGAVFKTLTLGTNAHGNVIFASDFHNGQVDIFDKNFQLVGSLTDPNPHAGFAPFGVHNLNGTLFVTFAKQDDPNDAHDDVEGPGNGFIDEFTINGDFIKRFATGSALQPGGLDVLNSPFGAAVAPADFGQFSSTPNNPVLLIGNFGSSQISAFNMNSGAFLGQLSDAQGNPLVLNGGISESDKKGLWGIRFGNGHGGADANTLFFAAGINAEADGLFGKVTAVTNPSIHHSTAVLSKSSSAQLAPLVAQGNTNGAAGQIPAFFNGQSVTINVKQLSDTSAASIIEHNKNLNIIYVTNDLDEKQDFTPVINAVPGHNFNALWLQIEISFNPGVTPHQFTSEADILAAAKAGQISLINTGEVYRDSVVGGG